MLITHELRASKTDHLLRRSALRQERQSQNLELHLGLVVGKRSRGDVKLVDTSLTPESGEGFVQLLLNTQAFHPD
jgi:hypothetical protein